MLIVAKSAVVLDLRGHQPPIGDTLPLDLDVTGCHHSFPDRGARLASLTFTGDDQVFRSVDLDQEVDPVEQGPRDLAAVAADLLSAADAWFGAIAIKATGTGIHRCQQLEPGRELRLPCRARDDNVARFQRLA